MGNYCFVCVIVSVVILVAVVVCGCVMFGVVGSSVFCGGVNKKKVFLLVCVQVLCYKKHSC